MNLYQLSKGNQPTLHQDYQSSCEEIQNANLLNELLVHLEEKGEATFSTFSGFAFQSTSNGKVLTGFDAKHPELVLSQILNMGKYLSAWEVWNDDEKCKEHFGKKAPQRITFDETFEFGKKFKYFNLNNGQSGMPNWGNFTFAFPLENFDEDKFVLIKHNSLIGEKDNTKQGYYFTTDNQTINIDFLQKDLATKEDFCKIVVVKSQNEIKKGETDFNLFILKPFENSKHSDYIEVITWQDVEINNVTLRFEEAIYRAISDEIASFFERKSTLDETSIILLNDLFQLMNSYFDDERLNPELI